MKRLSYIFLSEAIMAIKTKGRCMKKMLLVLWAGLFLMTVTGCETVKGVGKDLETAGQKIEDAVK
jgi:entericidin B